MANDPLSRTLESALLFALALAAGNCQAAALFNAAPVEPITILQLSPVDSN